MSRTATFASVAPTVAWHRDARCAEPDVEPRASWLWSSDALLLDILEIPAWHAQAACREVRDPDIFFPKRGGSSKEARAICTRCPVLDECLKWTLETRPD